MTNKSEKTLIVVGGPTASGKTSLGITIAQHFQTEIISADSRQFYKELNIGVAKPTSDELAAVPHHFIGHKSIHDYYSAGEFEREAMQVLTTLFKTQDYVVMVGGSGLFINAVLHGFHEAPKDDGSTRQALDILYAEHGIAGLVERLTELDPAHAQVIDLQNPQRLMRALERVIISGKTHAELNKGMKAERPFRVVEVAIDHDREQLYDRINQRVDQMVEEGLVEEVKSLVPFKHLNALNTVGYSELFAHFEGACTFEEAIEQIKQNTRRYAKRQITWFKNKSGSVWVKPNEFDKILEMINEQ